MIVRHLQGKFIMRALLAWIALEGLSGLSALPPLSPIWMTSLGTWVLIHRKGNGP